MQAPPTSNQRRIMSIRVNPTTYDLIARIAEDEDRTISYVAARILDNALQGAS